MLLSSIFKEQSVILILQDLSISVSPHRNVWLSLDVLYHAIKPHLSRPQSHVISVFVRQPSHAPYSKQTNSSRPFPFYAFNFPSPFKLKSLPQSPLVPHLLTAKICTFWLAWRWLPPWSLFDATRMEVISRDREITPGLHILGPFTWCFSLPLLDFSYTKHFIGLLLDYSYLKAKSVTYFPETGVILDIPTLAQWKSDYITQ